MKTRSQSGRYCRIGQVKAAGIENVLGKSIKETMEQRATFE